MWASHPRSFWVRSCIHQTLQSPVPTSALSRPKLLLLVFLLCPSLPSPHPTLCPALNQSLSPSLSLTHALSHSLALSVSVSWCFPGSHICFSLASLYLCVWITLPISLSLSLSLSLHTHSPNSAVSTSPNFNCLNCLFCGWAVIKRYLGYSPLGLRSGLPGSSDHKGHSWVE